MKSKQKGFCVNIDSCKSAFVKLIQETEESNFVCAGCGSKLVPYKV